MKTNQFIRVCFVVVILTFLITPGTGLSNDGRSEEDGAIISQRPQYSPGEFQISSLNENPLVSKRPFGDTEIASTNPISATVLGMDTLSPTSVTTYTVDLGKWRNIRPTESYLRSVSLLPADAPVDCQSIGQESKGWIVGTNGTILSYCNGVWDHAIVVESIPTTLWGVEAISPTLAVAVGDDGAVLHYVYDQVANTYEWIKLPIQTSSENLFNVSMVKDGNRYVGWAIGDHNANGKGIIVRGEITPAAWVNGHLTYQYDWENVTDSFPNLPDVDYYYGIEMLSPTNGWIAGGLDGSFGVLLHWDGSQWSVFQQIGTKRLFGLHFRSPNDGWVVGNGGVIYHFNGSSWSEVESPTTNPLLSVGFTEDGVGWAVGTGGVILKYVDGEWELFTDLRSDPIDMWDIDFTSGHGWTVGVNPARSIGGHILEYTEDLWLPVTPPTDNQLNDVSVLSDSDAWAVGVPDSYGGTIIHWDGRHWQRWYQKDLPIPAVNLQAIDMVSPTDGWAAGDPPTDGAPAVMLHWDGHRWAQPRYDAPVNVRINDIAMLNKDFGWAVANNGNAVAKYDGTYGYWSANHTCNGYYYQLNGVDIVEDGTLFGDAWSVGRSVNSYFMRYMSGCSGGYAWDSYDTPVACPDNDGKIPPDGPAETDLLDIAMEPGSWGYVSGQYKDRASLYIRSDNASPWERSWCMPPNDEYFSMNPSKLYSVDIIPGSGVGWFGGYYTFRNRDNRKEALVIYRDSLNYFWVDYDGIIPLNGRGIYHRPISSISMSSDTMGWAVGDPEGGKSVIYQYPFPNFTLSASPDIRAVKPGGTVEFTLDVNTLGDLDTSVTLVSIASIPGTTVLLDPQIIQPGLQAQLSVETTAATPIGEYEITIQGSSTFMSGNEEITVDREKILRLIVTETPVYSISPIKEYAGNPVVISGEGLGADPGPGNRSTPENHVILAGQQLPDSSITSWSDTQIDLTVPDAPVLFPRGPETGRVQVVAHGNVSNDELSFTLLHRLIDLSYSEETDYYEITLSGTSFGNDPGSLWRSTAYEHIALSNVWIPNTDVLSWSNNTIVLRVPLGSPSGLITVTANGMNSNGLPFSPVTPNSGYKVYLPMQRK